MKKKQVAMRVWMTEEEVKEKVVEWGRNAIAGELKSPRIETDFNGFQWTVVDINPENEIK